MLLAIDVGNTNMVFGLFQGETLKAKFRLSTQKICTADEIGLTVAQFFLHFGFALEEIEAAVVGSVVPQVMYTLRHALNKYIQKPLYIVRENLPIALESVCQEPLGSDRAITGLAAMRMYGKPVIVIDFGTATTFDAFSEKGVYLGGLICPGISISMEALFAKAAKLPRIEIKKPRAVIGINTVEQMQAGAVYGFVGSVEGVVELMKRDMENGDIPVAATGGLARLIAEHSPAITHVDENLTLHGLRMIYEER